MLYYDHPLGRAQCWGVVGCLNRFVRRRGPTGRQIRSSDPTASSGRAFLVAIPILFLMSKIVKIGWK